MLYNCFGSDYWNSIYNNDVTNGNPFCTTQYLTFVQPDYTTLMATGGVNYSYTLQYAGGHPPVTRSIVLFSSIQVLSTTPSSASMPTYAVEHEAVPANTQIHVSIDVRDLVKYWPSSCYTAEFNDQPPNPAQCYLPTSLMLNACNDRGCAPVELAIVNSCEAEGQSLGYGK